MVLIIIQWFVPPSLKERGNIMIPVWKKKICQEKNQPGLVIDEESWENVGTNKIKRQLIHNVYIHSGFTSA